MDSCPSDFQRRDTATLHDGCFHVGTVPEMPYGGCDAGLHCFWSFRGQRLWIVGLTDFCIQITFYNSKDMVSMSVSEVPWMMIGCSSRHGRRNEWRPKWG